MRASQLLIMHNYAQYVVTYVLLGGVSKSRLCGTMRKIPDAYTATYGILSSRMRYHAEIHSFSHTVRPCYLYITMRKVAGAYASTCGAVSTVLIIQRYTIVARHLFVTVRKNVNAYTIICEIPGFSPCLCNT